MEENAMNKANQAFLSINDRVITLFSLPHNKSQIKHDLAAHHPLS